VTIATISKQGLLALAILVAVLWGCWLVQQHYLSQAKQNVRRSGSEHPAASEKVAPDAAFGIAWPAATGRTSFI